MAAHPPPICLCQIPGQADGIPFDDQIKINAG